MARTINWNQAKLDALIEAFKAARGPTITVSLPDEKEPAQFDLRYAGHLIQYLQGEFARNPPPVYPENREGDEP